MSLWREPTFSSCHITLVRGFGIRVPTFLRAYVLPLLSCTPLLWYWSLCNVIYCGNIYRHLAVQLLTAGLVYASCVGGGLTQQTELLALGTLPRSRRSNH